LITPPAEISIDQPALKPDTPLPKVLRPEIPSRLAKRAKRLV